MAALVARARAAQAIAERYDQARIDELVAAAGWAILEPARNRELAELAVRDTGIGDVEDKVLKNHRKTLGLLRDLHGMKTVGELFGAGNPSSGTMVVEAPSTSKVYAVIESGSSQTTTSQIPLPTNLSESLTSAGFFGQRPLYLDGLEQSTEASRGSRWMLLLNEVGGAAGSIAVRLYEAGNRSRPIAERDFSVAAYQHLSLDTVFAELGLDSDSRRKDRTNVLLTVTARSGNARIAASAVSTDNVSGDVKVFALQPATGSGSPNTSLVSPVQAPPAPRRRAVGR